MSIAVSEEHNASIFRVEQKAEQETRVKGEHSVCHLPSRTGVHHGEKWFRINAFRRDPTKTGNLKQQWEGGNRVPAERAGESINMNREPFIGEKLNPVTCINMFLGIRFGFWAVPISNERQRVPSDGNSLSSIYLQLN
jgi:hypothetical protein